MITIPRKYFYILEQIVLVALVNIIYRVSSIGIINSNIIVLIGKYIPGVPKKRNYSVSLV